MWTVTNSTVRGKRYTATADGYPPIHFGSSQHENYTIHKDEKRKLNYLKRHAPTEDWEDISTAGAWSRWMLWNKTTLLASAKDMADRFDVDIRLNLRGRL